MPAIQKVSWLVLLVCVVPVIVAAWPVMASVVREGTRSAIVLMSLIGLAGGHLAFATVSRHPGAAIAVATLTDERLAPIGVLLAVLVGELAVDTKCGESRGCRSGTIA